MRDVETETRTRRAEQRASYIPTPTGGTLETTLSIGGQEVSLAWPTEGANETLRALLDRLMVRVESVTYEVAPDGGEINVTLDIGDQRLAVRHRATGELGQALEQLMGEIRTSGIASLRAALDREVSAGAGSP
jgi:hypothetical protein